MLLLLAYHARRTLLRRVRWSSAPSCSMHSLQPGAKLTLLLLRVRAEECELLLVLDTTTRPRSALVRALDAQLARPSSSCSLPRPALDLSAAQRPLPCFCGAQTGSMAANSLLTASAQACILVCGVSCACRSLEGAGKLEGTGSGELKRAN